MEQHSAPTNLADVEMPSHRRNKAEGAFASQGLGPTPKHRLRVLIVEDQSFIALDCEMALRARGHEVVGVASTADEAAKLAGQHHPDLVLMDIRLASSRTGLEAAIEIYRSWSIRCIFTSAHGDDFTRRLAEPANPLGWINKPYTCEEMLKTVETAGEGLAG
jgi:DNA-binding NarL/FixJ family response regulator